MRGRILQRLLSQTATHIKGVPTCFHPSFPGFLLCDFSLRRVSVNIGSARHRKNSIHTDSGTAPSTPSSFNSVPQISEKPNSPSQPHLGDDQRRENPSDSGAETTPASVRVALLDAALKHVKTHGWTKAALQEGAKALHLSPATVALLEGGPADLFQHFVDCSNREAIQQCKSQEMQALHEQEMLTSVLRARLEKNIPYIECLPQGLYLQAQPRNSPRALQSLGQFINDVWYLCGDRSLDMTWYTKRAALGSVYVALELYMVTDFSPDFSDTWDQLHKGLQDVMKLHNSAVDVRGLLHSALQRVSNVQKYWAQRAS